MKNKNIFIALGLGVVAYFLLKTKPVNQQRPGYMPIQEPPPRGSFAFQQWLNTILDAYGRSAWLFQPGGPFYKSKILNEKELNKILKEPVYDLPSTTPTSSGQGDYEEWT
jgi:hypothetical protein